MNRLYVQPKNVGQTRALTQNRICRRYMCEITLFLTFL